MSEAREEIVRREVLGRIRDERERQQKKWGDQWKYGATPPEVKLAILVEEVGEVSKEVLEGGEQYQSLQVELVQVAAVCVAWLESLSNEEKQ